MVFKLGILGLGTVGGGVAKILADPAQRHPLVQDLSIHRVGVRDVEKPRAVSLAPGVLTTHLEAIVTDPEIAIVVELLGGVEPSRSLILKAIAHGKHIITANKAVIARHGEEIFEAAAAQGVYVLLEAAVGGGIPVIEPLKQSLCANRIHGLLAIVNGTTNYILTRMQREGGDFAPILEDAQHLGYAEADPSADVDGLDAADKIAILASLAFGGRIDRSKVYTEGIRQVTAADISYAESLGFVIKLLAVARRIPNDSSNEQIDIRVHPTLVPFSHPLSNVNDVFNAILIEGDPVGQVMFYGPGAGSGPTASAVVADILNIAALLTMGRTEPRQEDGTPLLDPLLACHHHHYCRLSPIEETENRFYARLVANDRPGVIGQLGTCFGDRGVSLESIVQLESSDEEAVIVVVTHDVREGNFRAAIADLQNLETVKEVSSILRVL
ncbi:MAG: homoserine dehydrogenase [Prochlorotrichaceae cyanobacterium]